MARRSSARKGLSELVVIMVAVAIAIPVMFLLQSWLTSQLGKMPELGSVDATYTVRSINGSLILSLQVSNRGTSPVEIREVTVSYTNASGSPASMSYSGASQPLVGQLPTTIGAKSTINLVLKVDNASGILSVTIHLRSLSTGSEASMPAVGA